MDGLTFFRPLLPKKKPEAKGIIDAYTQKILTVKLLSTQKLIFIKKECAVLREHVYFHVCITPCICRVLMGQLS